jgi:hypothetical protein
LFRRNYRSVSTIDRFVNALKKSTHKMLQYKYDYFSF